MKRVTFPLQLESRGDAVVDLQDALQFLLDRAIIRIAQPERSDVEERLRIERGHSEFGEQTHQLVMAMQELLRLKPSGAVDQRTAAILNAELLRNGVLQQEPSPPDSPGRGALFAERLLPLLRTSTVLREGAELQRFVGLLTEQSDFSLHAWASLAAEAGLSERQIDEVKLTLELASITQHDLPLIAALQELRSSGRIRSGRDLVGLNRDEWQSLMRNSSAADRETRLAAIETRLLETFPTVCVARALAAPLPIDLALIRRVIAATPSLDIAAQALDTLDFTGFSDDERQSALASLGALRQEIKAYPDLDPQVVLQARGDAGARALNPIRTDVVRFLTQAQDFDLRNTRIGPYVADHPDAMDGVVDASLATAQLQRMQRVFRVAPSFDAMNALMGEGFHSAFRIARMPADVFVARFSGRLGDAVSAQTAYAAARSVTATTAAIAWAVRMRSAGPLPAAVGTWPPPELAIEDAELRQLLQAGGRPNHT